MFWEVSSSGKLTTGWNRKWSLTSLIMIVGAFKHVFWETDPTCKLRAVWYRNWSLTSLIRVVGAYKPVLWEGHEAPPKALCYTQVPTRIIEWRCCFFSDRTWVGALFKGRVIGRISSELILLSIGGATEIHSSLLKYLTSRRFQECSCLLSVFITIVSYICFNLVKSYLQSASQK